MKVLPYLKEQRPSESDKAAETDRAELDPETKSLEKGDRINRIKKSTGLRKVEASCRLDASSLILSILLISVYFFPSFPGY
jgi:hypothetical protein